MISACVLRMTEAEKKVREYLAAIVRRGGLASRRELSQSHAKQMVAIREAKRAAQKAEKPWPPRNRRLLRLREYIWQRSSRLCRPAVAIFPDRCDTLRWLNDLLCLSHAGRPTTLPKS